MLSNRLALARIEIGRCWIYKLGPRWMRRTKTNLWHFPLGGFPIRGFPVVSVIIGLNIFAQPANACFTLRTTFAYFPLHSLLSAYRYDEPLFMHRNKRKDGNQKEHKPRGRGSPNEPGRNRRNRTWHWFYGNWLAGMRRSQARTADAFLFDAKLETNPSELQCVK